MRSAILLKTQPLIMCHSLMIYSSAYDLAWTRIFTTDSDLASSERLRALFPNNDDWLEERQFSRLHSIVLGLIPGNLEEVLAEPDININATDSRGRTALSWAVQRQDHVSTRLLLQHGADPNIANPAGGFPIPAAIAAFAHDVIGIKLLLDYGAVATLRDQNGYSCLHNACANATLCDAIEVLIAAGCDLHEKNSWGSTSLNVAAQSSSSAVLCTLMSHGSDINTIDIEGYSPLMNALFTGKDENVQLLLKRKADYTVINNYGQTVLHQAALSGSLATLEILRSANLSRIDPNAKDQKGKTAFQLAQGRHTKPEGFINLFLTLLFEIRCQNDALARDGEQSQGVASAETLELSESTEAGRDGSSPGEGSSEGTTMNTGRSAGTAEPARDDENGGDDGESFFDALEQQ